VGLAVPFGSQSHAAHAALSLPCYGHPLVKAPHLTMREVTRALIAIGIIGLAHHFQ
jgi:hypothetical protein